MDSFMRETKQGDSSRNNTDIPHGRTPEPWNLYNFYSAVDGPWFPSGIIRPSAPTDQTCSPLNGDLSYQYNFQDYRSAGQASDCATIPGDSGYCGSRPACSVESASVNEEDHTIDNHLAEQLMGACNVDMEDVSQDPQAQDFNGAGSMKHFCSNCRIWVKTKSELNKHTQRHLKPHLCTYSSCSRSIEGFSTTNDLIRHKRTVHNEHQRHGRSFVCSHCIGQNKKHKQWPRADNFRSHLARVHRIYVNADDGIQQYLYSTPELPEDLKGIGTSVSQIEASSRPMELQESPESQARPMLTDPNFSDKDDRQNALSSLTHVNTSPNFLHHMNQPVESSTHEEESTYIHPDVLNEANGYASAEGLVQSRHGHLLPGDGGSRIDIGSSHPHLATDQTMSTLSQHVELTSTYTDEPNGLEWQNCGSISSDSSESVSGHMGIVASRQMHNESVDDGAAHLLDDAMPNVASNPDVMVNFLRTLPKGLLQTALNGDSQESDQASHQEESSTRAYHSCSECKKGFGRPCELKKHMKRHEKPYGCTFRECSKLFGSKNDWKRHESSQHYQLESWNCQEPDCKKICHRRESFKNHLQKDHKLEDQQALERKLEICRIGRHCDPRFWCGFCARIIEVEETGGNSWTRRCDHIDYHLFGKEGLEKKRIGEWQYLEDEEGQSESGSPTRAAEALAQTSQPPPDTSEASVRKRKSSMEADPRPRKKAESSGTQMWKYPGA